MRQYFSTPDLRQTGWNKDSGRFFAENRREFQEGGSHVYAATCYFGRLLAWGESVFGQAGGVALSSNDSSYVSIHNTMGSISFDEIKRSGEDEQKTDNLTAHICRLAVAAFLRENAASTDANPKRLRGHGYGVPMKLWVDQQGVKLALGQHKVEEALKKFIKPNEAAALVSLYTA